MRYFLSILAVGTALCPLFAQQTKTLTAEKHNEYGIVYSLPTTALRINVTARKEVRKAGPYFQYAKKFLGKSDVVKEDAVSWTVADISVTPVGVRDDERQYLMQLKPGVLTYVVVNADGMLQSINAAPEEESQNQKRGREAARKGETPGVDDYLNYVDMDFVSAQSSMKQAEMIAGSLMDVRDAYLSLTRGTADNLPTDGRQLELMLASLRDQESALTRAFTGTVSVEEVTSQYLYIPEEDGEEVLFRLSDFEGFVDAEDYSGFPVYIKTEIMMQGEMPVDATGQPKKLPKDAVMYALPGTARISLYTDRGNLFDQEYDFAQFGTTFGLAPTLFTDKKAPSFARFSPVTGALLEVGKMAEEKE